MDDDVPNDPPKDMADAIAQIASLKRSVAFYIEKANEAWKVAEEQRARRLALEEEVGPIQP